MALGTLDRGGLPVPELAEMEACVSLRRVFCAPEPASATPVPVEPAATPAVAPAAMVSSRGIVSVAVKEIEPPAVIEECSANARTVLRMSSRATATPSEKPVALAPSATAMLSAPASTSRLVTSLALKITVRPASIVPARIVAPTPSATFTSTPAPARPMPLEPEPLPATPTEPPMAMAMRVSVSPPSTLTSWPALTVVVVGERGSALPSSA